MGGKRLLFYASVSDARLFEITGFYKTDIQILRDLGYDVVPTNQISDFLNPRGYDVAFFYFYTKSCLPALIARTFGKKVLFTGGMDDLAPEFNLDVKNRRKRVLLLKLAYRLADAVILVSESDRQTVLHDGLPAELPIVPHVVDLSLYRYDQEPKTLTACTIAWMGTRQNVIRKGVDRALYIFNEFVLLDPHAQFVIIGYDGPGRTYLEGIAAGLGISKHVEFRCGITEVEKLRILKSSLFYFQVSRFEGFGVAAIEALATGGQVVHSGKGGLRYTLTDRGILSDGETDFKKVARQMFDYQNQPQLRARVITSNLKHVRDHYEYSVRLHGIENFLNKAGASNKSVTSELNAPR
jgi:glycosyltransferase involved in cell wall biosynthesis